MVIKPMIRNNMCLNAHPAGCKKGVQDQIAYTKTRTQQRKNGTLKEAGVKNSGPKNVLVIGCSTGYGLATRIAAAFGYGAKTIGVSFEKAARERKPGTPGWYNNRTFDSVAKQNGLFSATLEGDAFADEMKQNVIALANDTKTKFDLVVYSLASPVRVDPETGVMYKSVLKPFGKTFSGPTIDPFTGKLGTVSAEPATEDEAAQTVKVMGGEDWERWISHLSKAGVLADGCLTLAYSYIGPEATQALYRKGTIGKAKEHLEATAISLTKDMTDINGRAFVAVNKAVVTRSSAVIPVIPLYITSLFAVMKKEGSHEGCIEQMNRLMDSKLYRDDKTIPTDPENRIRLDDWELDPKVQAQVDALMPKVTSENSNELVDLEGFRHDFLATSGFDIEGVDYEADTICCDDF
ncbi:MAG TPA: enoyl-ACP reductase FabV [Treponemataceae bacterium]|nr:enoyl-ACP reductase FabV [Treponemataceae bacterium]